MAEDVVRLQNNVQKERSRLFKVEKIKRLKEVLYQKQPMLWLKEKFDEDPANFQWSKRPAYANKKVLPWGQEKLFEIGGIEHVKEYWDGDIDPLYKAWQAIANGERHIAIEACTGSSKTFFLSRLVFWFLDVFPNSLVVTGAPKQAQLSLHLWSEISTAFNKFKKIRPNAALYSSLRLVVDEQDQKTKNNRDNWDEATTDKSWHAVGFVAGVGSEEASATKAQGFHREHMLIIVEETPGMPNAVMTAFKNTATGSKNFIVAVGNPDSQIDPLHIYAKQPHVKNFRISGYDYPNIVEGKEVIPGAVSTRSIKDRKTENGELSDLYKSRVRGISPSQSVNSLIKAEWVEDAVKGFREKRIVYDQSYHAVGADAANSIDGDKACLAWGEGNILVELQDFQCPNATHLAYNLFLSSAELMENGYLDYGTSKLNDYSVMREMIGVDVVGIGVATMNTLVDNGFNPIGLSGGQWLEAIPLVKRYDNLKQAEVEEPKYKFANLRSQMYWEAREDLRMGLIGIALEDETIIEDLMMELISVLYVSKDNYIAIESKENIKKKLGGKSPNKADAFVYWNWTRKGYRISGGIMPVI